MLQHKDHLSHLQAVRRAAMEAADAQSLVERVMRVHDDVLQIKDNAYALTSSTRVILVALGKAAPAMCNAAVRILGRRLTTALAVVPRAYQARLPAGVRVFHGGHPLPDEGSLAAGIAVAETLASTSVDDLVLALISGGGSAMLELPLPGIDLEDLRTLNVLLLRSGAPIQAINTVRRSLSQIKAGGLARMAAPARIVSLILSDVVGDSLRAIASGPTVLHSVSPSHARAVLEQYQLWSQIPPSIQQALERPRVPLPRTPRPKNVLIGSNRLVVQAARHKAAKLGFSTKVLTYAMRGEAHAVGKRIAVRLRRAPGPVCLLSGGETTVDIRGEGNGGRNQELALAAALAFEGVPNVALMALATDGVDGPTSAAGAIVTGESVTQARSLGLHPEAALQANDSHPFHRALNTLLVTGPTGTNLNDLVVGLKYTSEDGHQLDLTDTHFS